MEFVGTCLYCLQHFKIPGVYTIRIQAPMLDILEYKGVDYTVFWYTYNGSSHVTSVHKFKDQINTIGKIEMISILINEGDSLCPDR